AFYEKTQEKENTGFDAVIGNPPYRTLALGKGQETLDKNDAMYFRAEFPSSSEYKTNTFAMFTEQGIRLNCVGGRFSFILPSTICTNHYFRKFRNKLLVETKLDSLVEIDERIFPDVEIGGNTILVILKEKPAVNQSNFLKIYQISQSFDFVETSTIVQRYFLTTPDNKFLVQTKAFSIITKCVSHAKYLSEIAVFYNGIKTGNNEQFLSLSPSRLHRKVLRGRDINKYSLDWGGVYVLFDPAQLWSNTDETKYESSPKLIVRQTGDSLVAALDIDKYYTMDSTHLVIPYNPGVAKYILALYNSKLLNWYYHHIVPEVGRAFAEMKIVDLKKLPIYSIDFTTLPNLRQKKVAQATVLYQSGISSFDQILKWTQTELSADHNDTIHDLLDFLSAEMIEMNSQKQKLLKKFLHWLEKEIVKRSIDELRNKTKIQEFHKHPVSTLLAILKSNKCIPNPAPSKILDLIEKEFEDVMLKLSPLKEQIKATDQLIDQIIYKLYGLTQQEIQIVEGALNPHP
ncbi:MAG TPA: TaqI-like C-terminal specificity domain-containing protein, partial [Nitrososphaerales archaeon]